MCIEFKKEIKKTLVTDNFLLITDNLGNIEKIEKYIQRDYFPMSLSGFSGPTKEVFFIKG